MKIKNRGQTNKDLGPSAKYRNGQPKEIENKKCNEDKKAKIKNGEKPDEPTQSQRVRKCCGLSLATILKVLVLAIFIPPFLNYASLQKESRSLRPLGAFETSPKGHKLFMNCSGEGQPVVMMDTPGGSSSDIWSLVQPQVAKFTKVCVYDRTGLGFSESHEQGNLRNNSDDVIRKHLHPTVENMVDDLNAMLKASSNESPFILVGGGLGTVNARFYTQMFENIFGLVLINSFHEDMFVESESEWTIFWYEKLIPSLQLQQILASSGITRLGLLTGFLKPEILADTRLNDDVKTRQKYLLCNSGHLTSGIREHYYINESLTQLKILRKLKPFPRGVPVKIISSERFSHHVTLSLNDYWQRNQQLLGDEVFPNSERTLVSGDFNSVYFDNATMIVKAIGKLVNKFRKSAKQSAI